MAVIQVILGLVLLAAQLPLDAAIVPTDGMNITTDTTFTAGVYVLPSGVNIVADNVTLDLGGATLVGSGNGSGAGVTAIGRRAVTITSTAGWAGSGDGNTTSESIHGYFYGIVLVNCTGCTISNVNVSSNWRDPNANNTWLDINAPANLSDTTNLGGGVFVQASSQCQFQHIIANDQENGLDVYDSSNITVADCVASNNVGWGVHLHNTTDSFIFKNILDYNTRANLGDSAGILLVYGSHRNTIAENSCQYSGDGFFIGNENGCPSNYNIIEGNDCSHAGANAFEATFSHNNVFRSNTASYSNYGFWLGYSYNSTVENNIILGNGWGVDIDHGQWNVIQGNAFSNTNGPAIQLTSDGSSNFPQPCLALPNQTVSGMTTVTGNRFIESNNYHIMLVNTTYSAVYDNYFGPNLRPGTISADNLTTVSTRFQFADAPVLLSWPQRNVVGGRYLGGNWYVDYTGRDDTGDGIGTLTFLTTQTAELLV